MTLGVFRERQEREQRRATDLQQQQQDQHHGRQQQAASKQQPNVKPHFGSTLSTVADAPQVSAEETQSRNATPTVAFNLPSTSTQREFAVCFKKL